MEAGDTDTHERTFTHVDEGGEHTHLAVSVVVERDSKSEPEVVLDATVESSV